MTLRPCSSPSAAAWFTSSDLAWHRLVALGPSGFDAYARLRFLPDPLYNGQPEITLDNPNAPSEHELLQATLEVLGKHTTTTDEVYFCLWAGWGSDAFPPSVLNGARVAVQSYDYPIDGSHIIVRVHGLAAMDGARRAALTANLERISGVPVELIKAMRMISLVGRTH